MSSSVNEYFKCLVDILPLPKSVEWTVCPDLIYCVCAKDKESRICMEQKDFVKQCVVSIIIFIVSIIIIL